MAKQGILRTLSDGKLSFICPGCDMMHAVRVEPDKGKPCWGFNGNYDKPTFTPSILVRWDEGESREQKICHSFVTDGKIQFLGDCTHDLKNQTVDLADYQT